MKKMSFTIIIFFCFSLVGCIDNSIVTPTEKTYKITFDTGDSGIKINAIIAKENESISPPTDVIYDGYRLEGWYLGEEKYAFDVMPNHDIALTAKWTKLYFIHFEVSELYSQEKVSSVGFAEGEEIVLPTVNSTVNHAFSYWDLDGERFSPGIMGTSDFTLTAVFDVAVKIYLDFGSSEIKNDVIYASFGQEIEYENLPKKEGYRLSGWRTSSGFPYFLSTAPSEDIYLFAVWTKYDYTDVPAIHIDLYNESGGYVSIGNIDRENYQNAIISINNTSDENILDLASGEFRGRGNGSWTNSIKKGYKIKFTNKQAVLGENKSKHWVLLANQNPDNLDTSMLRNYSAYDIGQQVFDNIDYCTSTHFVDIYINGAYYGMYVLVEQIRVEDGRIEGNPEYGVLDTDYLIEYDAYASGTSLVDYFKINSNVKYNFSVKYPEADEYLENGITQTQFKEQITFLQGKTEEMYNTALSGDFEKWTELADLDSWVDMYILHELYKNTDTGWSSFYIFKKAGGKFYATAPWDFDFTTGVSRGSFGYTDIYVGGTCQSASSSTSSEILIALYKTQGFRDAVENRWAELSLKISDLLLNNYNEDFLNESSQAQAKNYQTWVTPTYSLSKCEDLWKEDSNTIFTWLNNRVNYLDSVWKSYL